MVTRAIGAPVDLTPHYVHPGQLASGRGPQPLATILGSCVAVCLHDPVAGVGGLNHFVLPECPDGGEHSSRYARGAIAQLLQRLIAQGTRERRIVARLVGGASVLAAFGEGEEHLGLRNVRMAEAILAERRIPVISSDVGGTRGRRLLFHPRDGAHEVTLLGR
jgi:chemotaxis protein CheD